MTYHVECLLKDGSKKKYHVSDEIGEKLLEQVSQGSKLLSARSKDEAITIAIGTDAVVVHIRRE